MASFPSSSRRLLAGLGLVAAAWWSSATAAYAEETGGDAPPEAIEAILALAEELEGRLQSLPPEEQARLRLQLVALLREMPPPPPPAAAASPEAVEPSEEAVAQQPAPRPQRRVAPAPEPTKGDPPSVAALEPGASGPTVEGPGVSDSALAQPEIVGVEPSGIEPSREASIAEAVEPGAAPETKPRATDLPRPPRAEPPAGARREDPPAPRNPRRCRTLEPFDTDGDGKLTGLDRYWRYFYLWTDVDEDRSVDEREVESPFERGIREVRVDLREFVRGKGKRKRSLEIQLEEHILLDVGGDGWSGAYPRGDDGALAVDTSAVREAGGPDARDGRGRPLEGVQPIRPDWILVLPDGEELRVNCPRG
ncbi:MAG: hypothetical protein AAF725_23595 [Acidobacteriota bacterium]